MQRLVACGAAPSLEQAYRKYLRRARGVHGAEVWAALGEVIKRCTALGMRQMVAVIGDSANSPSIRLHESLGFRRAALLRSAARADHERATADRSGAPLARGPDVQRLTQVRHEAG